MGVGVELSIGEVTKGYITEDNDSSEGSHLFIYLSLFTHHDFSSHSVKATRKQMLFPPSKCALSPH